MPDITMCQQKSCNRRSQCYRYRAVPGELMQVYFRPNPETCTNFLSVESEHRKFRRMQSIKEIESVMNSGAQ